MIYLFILFYLVILLFIYSLYYYILGGCNVAPKNSSSKGDAKYGKKLFSWSKIYHLVLSIQNGALTFSERL